MAQDAAKLHILQAMQRCPPPHTLLPPVADGPLLARQANLESVVGQLDAKTNEVAAATQEAATQKALVQQITKKLDVLSKRCKTLEQENTRMAEAQVGRVEAEVQTEPDAVLLRAQAETAAAQESLRDAKADWDAMAAGLQAQAAQEAVEQLAALEVANEARHALEAELQQANERAASAASESAAQRAAEAARAADQANTVGLEPTTPPRTPHSAAFVPWPRLRVWLPLGPDLCLAHGLHLTTRLLRDRPGRTTCGAARRPRRWRRLAERGGGAAPRGRGFPGDRARAHQLRGRAGRAARSRGGGVDPPAEAGAAGWVD